MSFLDPLFAPFLFLALLLFWLFGAIGWRAGDLQSPHLLVLGASLLFYAHYSAGYLALLLSSSFIAYYSAEQVIKVDHARGRIWVLFLALLLLCPLIFFKYSSFLFSGFLPAGKVDSLGLIFPLGISFYTFQNISYLAGVATGRFPAARNLLEYLTYISFFPQLVAGPIVSAHNFLPQLWRKISILRLDIRGASFYLLSGYLKKAVLADHLATVVDPAFGNPQAYSGAALTVAVLAYTLQIYFDFSGYSDIAIGAGRLFGIRLPENFNFPYSAVGLRDFWRRWHITLSVWLRDHLYIPLGGSRLGPARLVLALLVTMTLGGLWHGAHWNFVIWGLAHGLLLVLERPLARWAGRLGDGSRTLLLQVGRLATFCAIALLWVPFRTGTMPMGFDRAILIYQAIFTWQAGIFSETGLRLTTFAMAALMLASFQYEHLKKGWFRGVPTPVLGGAAAALAILIFAFAGGGGAFIYFVF